MNNSLKIHNKARVDMTTNEIKEAYNQMLDDWDEDKAEQYAQEQLYPDNGVFQFTRPTLNKYRELVEKECFSKIESKVLENLKELGIPEMVSKKELYDVMDVSTPQEIGEIKTLLNMLDLLEDLWVKGIKT